MHRPTTRHAALALVALTIALIALAAPPQAPATAAPGPAQAPEGAILGVGLAGDRVVSLVSTDIPDRPALFSAPLSGGATRLGADLPEGAIEQFATTPGGRVLVVLRRSDGGQRFLYSLPAAGGAATLLGPSYTSPAGGSQLVLGLSPAGDRAVFLADVARRDAFELFSAPVAGGPLAKLSVPLPVIVPDHPGQVYRFAFSGDGRFVVYELRPVSGSLSSTLYRVPAAGGASLDLGPGAVRSGEALAVARDGSRIVFASDSELVSAAGDGGGRVVLESAGGIAFALTPDDARVLYVVSGAGPGATIKSVPAAGGAAVTAASDVQYRTDQTFVLTPDGAGVLFNSADGSALLRAPVLGGAPQTVIGAPVSPSGLVFTADGARALFVAGDPGAQALYSYPLAGGAPLRIDDPAHSAGGFLAFDGVVAGGRAIYAASSAASGGAMRLYGVPVGGGASAPIAGPFGAGQELIFARLATPGGAVVFTTGDRGLPSMYRWRQLYAVPADGSAPARLLSTTRLTVHLPLVVR